MERDMRAFSLALLSLLALASAAAAESVTSYRLHQAISACQREMPGLARMRCLQAAFAAADSCTGTVEERLTCLEGRIAKQAREIVQLKYELDKLNRPRVQPLDGSYLSER